ncbi:MAG: HEAT repeat domain-containing protein [Candidatus Omnitrophica bacterium]|nr:HEAT repeat domain-containing protein [Candidatus Omnitrophota bacterium]
MTNHKSQAVVIIGVIVMIGIATLLILQFFSTRNAAKLQQVSFDTASAVSVKIENRQEARVQESMGSYTVDQLIQQLGDDDIALSQQAAQQLVMRGASVVPALLEKAKEAPVFLKGQLIFVTGRIGDDSAVQGLIEFLKDDNGYIRRNVVEALGKIKDDSASLALAEMLFDDDEMVRMRSALALGALGNSLAVDALLNRMQDEQDAIVKSAIVDALGELKDPRSVALLIQIVSSPGEDFLYKEKAVVALGKIADSAAVPVLEAYLSRLTSATFKDPGYDFQRQTIVRAIEEALHTIKVNNS